MNFTASSTKFIIASSHLRSISMVMETHYGYTVGIMGLDSIENMVINVNIIFTI